MEYGATILKREDVREGVVHTHEQDGQLEFMNRQSIFGWSTGSWKKLDLFHVLRPLTVGIVHGLW
jgi:hypothetical protein